MQWVTNASQYTRLRCRLVSSLGCGVGTVIATQGNKLEVLAVQ